MSPRRCFRVVAIVLAFAAYAGNAKPDKGLDAALRDTFHSEIPDYPGNVILARPTDHSVTANVMLNKDARLRIRYGAEGKTERQTEIFALKAGEPREMVLDHLPTDAACSYRLIDAGNNRPAAADYGSGTFHTRRSPESGFTFTVQADSHLDGHCLPELYASALKNALAQKPDFHIDLGDTFMTGKIATRQEAVKQYLAQRYYLGLIGHAAPLFMVLGNHDGEEVSKGGASGRDSLAIWACQQRERYFSDPVPDAFYSGDAERHPRVGQLQDYYAWEWGSALFVALDPYWYSLANKGGRFPWNMTLGKTQYDWLARTLRESHAPFKFVFIHQLVGGLDKAGRGGVEAASLFEWGGHEKNGENAFAAHRPGWEKPIHELLVETGVSAVFHGHDHFFAHQSLDGVVYQLVPQPAHRGSGTRQAEEYGYREGVFFPNSGFLKIAVTPASATVTYVRAGPPTTPKSGADNDGPAYSYRIGPSSPKARADKKK